MEKLMSQIYQNALRSKLDPDASPIDLSWTSRKVCDGLIVPEDLRPELYVTKDTPVKVKLVDRFHQPSESLLSSSECSIDSSLSETSSVCSDDNVYIKQEPGYQGRQSSPYSDSQGRQPSPYSDSQGRQPSPYSDSKGRQPSPLSDSQGRQPTPCCDYQGRQPSPYSGNKGRQLHPFSIESLIDCKDERVKVDKPAVVTSTYTEQLMKTSISVNPYYIPRLSTDAVTNTRPGLMSHSMNTVPNLMSCDTTGPRLMSCDTTGPSLMSCDRNLAFWCHVCNALCVNYNDAQCHQYSHKIQNIKCNLRKSMFNKIGYVSQHEKLDDEKMQCGLCNKIVANCFFTKHQRLHDGHICNVCDTEFSTNSRLKDHMNIHTGNTPFICKLCDRQFAKRSSLTQHHRYHRDHQSFKCNYCSKYFNSKYARSVHERLHTGENPFKCQILGCKRSFPQKIQLTLHMNSHKC